MNEKLNVSKLNGHLIEGVKPIVACIGSLDDFKKSAISVEHPGAHISNNFLLHSLKNIDWRYGTYGSEEKDCLTAGPRTYVISAIDNSNKFSEDFGSCTALIVAGIDKQTGKNISFATHQPYATADFIDSFQKRLFEMKERCKSGTVDAVIVGGVGSVLKEMYIEVIQLLSTKTQQILGFEPIVINGPKNINPKLEDIFYDNDHRRLYFIRPEVNPDTGSFVSSDADNEKGKWE